MHVISCCKFLQHVDVVKWEIYNISWENYNKFTTSGCCKFPILQQVYNKFTTYKIIKIKNDARKAYIYKLIVLPVCIYVWVISYNIIIPLHT